MRPPIGALLAVLFVAACGGAATPSTAPAPTATAPGTAGPVAQGTWSVGDTSKATVRVREQLVGVSAPSDAVLVATGATGSFTLNVDGTFTSDSKISFDLTTLTSDQRDRDREPHVEVRRLRHDGAVGAVPRRQPRRRDQGGRRPRRDRQRLGAANWTPTTPRSGGSSAGARCSRSSAARAPFSSPPAR